MVINLLIALICTGKVGWVKVYFLNIQYLPKQIHGGDPQQLSSKVGKALVGLKNKL